MRAGLLLALLLLLLGCGKSVAPPTKESPPPQAIALDAEVDAAGQARLSRDLTIAPGASATLELTSGAPRVLELSTAADGEGLTASFGANESALPVSLPPSTVSGALRLTLRSTATTERRVRVRILVYGAPVPSVTRERSLFWTDANLLDDHGVIGLGRLLAAIAPDHHGGRLFAAWFRRFATTSHSERALQSQLIDGVEATQGKDPTKWDLDRLGFKVTAIHNRIDLGRGAGCGELRISLASTDTKYQPFHLIFLFRQEPLPNDRDLSGVITCLASGRRWAALAALSDEAFRTEAKRLLDETLTADRFVIAESLENMVSPWEWRQWKAVPNPDPASAAALPWVLDNPPLFQQVEVEALNAQGAKREAFLSWVRANAAALDARAVLLPEQFRAPSTRVTQGVPRPTLALDGLGAATAARFPLLRQKLEIIGCAACHTADAEFVQTRPDRTVSPFYEKELKARAVYLDELNAGKYRVAPQGPLQDAPVLPE